MPRDPAYWFAGAPDFYPAAAARVGAQGRVEYTLTIDAAGSVSGCRITASSGNADLDKTTCEVMLEYARFEPAVDDSGKAVQGEWSKAFRWVLPRRP